MRINNGTRTRTVTAVDLSGACFTVWRTGAPRLLMMTRYSKIPLYTCYDGTLYKI